MIKILFKHGEDPRDEVEAYERGYRGDIVVELANGRRYEVTFYDPVRLSQDVQRLAELGELCLAEPGMIIIPEVTMQNIRNAVEKLEQAGYFDRLIPCGTTGGADRA